MSWDIHGNKLERGHCEVHPWVHCEYPCPVCLDEQKIEIDNRQREFDGHNQLQLQSEHINQLEVENATLKAQRDELLEALNKIYLITEEAEPSGLIDEIWDISGKAIENCK